MYLVFYFICIVSILSFYWLTLLNSREDFRENKKKHPKRKKGKIKGNRERPRTTVRRRSRVAQTEEKKYIELKKFSKEKQMQDQLPKVGRKESKNLKKNQEISNAKKRQEFAEKKETAKVNARNKMNKMMELMNSKKN